MFSVAKGVMAGSLAQVTVNIFRLPPPSAASS